MNMKRFHKFPKLYYLLLLMTFFSLKTKAQCFEIESIAYSGDEAASKEKIAKRINTYPQGFIVKEFNNEVVGFINSGACHQVELSDHDFKEMIGHDPNGKHIERTNNRIITFSWFERSHIRVELNSQTGK